MRGIQKLLFQLSLIRDSRGLCLLQWNQANDAHIARHVDSVLRGDVQGIDVIGLRARKFCGAAKRCVNCFIDSIRASLGYASTMLIAVDHDIDGPVGSSRDATPNAGLPFLGSVVSVA